MEVKGIVDAGFLYKILNSCGCSNTPLLGDQRTFRQNLLSRLKPKTSNVADGWQTQRKRKGTETLEEVSGHPQGINSSYVKLPTLVLNLLVDFIPKNDTLFQLIIESAYTT